MAQTFLPKNAYKMPQLKTYGKIHQLVHGGQAPSFTDGFGHTGIMNSISACKANPCQGE